MSRLISAGFSRLFKSKCFIFFTIFAAFYSFMNIMSRYMDVINMSKYADGSLPASYYNVDVDAIAFDSAMTMMFAAAIFIGFFIGREYSDGTIRNKLIVGHSRGSIYLSNFVICVAAHIMGLFVAFIITLVVGIPLLGTSFSVWEILIFCFSVVIASVALDAIFLLISMLISSKSAQTAVLILGSFIMLFVTIYINESLSAPEYYSDYVISTTIDGETVIEEGNQIKNPFYLTGNKRKVYEFFDEFLPVSQLYRTANSTQTDLTKCAIYDIIILIAVTEAGVLLFCKKDIK
ncbi:MAG: ABC transporter permease subunit [Ruminococcaceae bacterium]|nr:ABC transporter permease subunit [Oscillospiraceae bacterium]